MSRMLNPQKESSTKAKDAAKAKEVTAAKPDSGAEEEKKGAQ